MKKVNKTYFFYYILFSPEDRCGGPAPGPAEDGPLPLWPLPQTLCGLLDLKASQENRSFRLDQRYVVKILILKNRAKGLKYKQKIPLPPPSLCYCGSERVNTVKILAQVNQFYAVTPIFRYASLGQTISLKLCILKWLFINEMLQHFSTRWKIVKCTVLLFQMCVNTLVTSVRKVSCPTRIWEDTLMVCTSRKRLFTPDRGQRRRIRRG